MTSGRTFAALRRCAPPVLAAAALWALGHRTGALLVAAIALTLAVVGLTAPDIAHRLDRAIARIATGLASAVARVLAVMGWSLGLLPVWALRRVAAPIRSSRTPSRDDSAWSTVPTTSSRNPDGTARDPRRAGSADPAGPRSPALTLIAVVVLTALLTTALVTTARRTGVDTAIADRTAASPPRAPATSPTADDSAQPEEDDIGAVEWVGLPVDDYAHEDEPWAKGHFRELIALPVRSDPFTGHRLNDFEGRYINVVDGKRVSYTPGDPELTVWFFGGSTMFGIGQRDDHTLPSVVAKAAEADGIRIRPVNFGVSGFTNWQSLEQFEQALTQQGAQPPDLAVFYEGINDWGLGSERADLGDVRPRSISRLALSDEERAQVRSVFDNVGRLEWSVERNQMVSVMSADQYRRGSALIDALARSYGVPVARAWQPSPFAKRPQPSDDELWDRLDYNPRFLPLSTQQYNDVRIKSGVDTTDLTTVLDEVDRPVYFDGGHTNELGARIIGEALYAAIRPQLVELAEA